ncbi:hypothetical protein KIL84_006310 [Mauremys mutica]|uniref:Uncharacterized protein n=1 Tax=Mauremys mutica TaxID=74926 RepID=A0A9D3WZ30_9SAUR|nr:hypothetical protein KIL84_006310 [Mauremys mutica]
MAATPAGHLCGCGNGRGGWSWFPRSPPSHLLPTPSSEPRQANLVPDSSATPHDTETSWTDARCPGGHAAVPRLLPRPLSRPRGRGAARGPRVTSLLGAISLIASGEEEGIGG